MSPSSVKCLSNVVNIAAVPRKQVAMKILVVGGYGVGKTSIVRRYVEDIFSTSYRSTIGIDFHQKSLLWTPNLVVNMQLWDVAGNDKFRCVTAAYYRNAHGAAIVFDVTKRETLDVAKVWLDEVRRFTCNPDGSKLPVVLLANKDDIATPAISNEAVAKFCEANDIKAWCSTSARLSINIDKAFSYLVEEAMNYRCDYEAKDEDAIKLDFQKPKPKQNCCK